MINDRATTMRIALQYSRPISFAEHMRPFNRIRQKPSALQTVAESWGLLWRHRLPFLVVIVPLATLPLLADFLPIPKGVAQVGGWFVPIWIAWLWFLCISMRVAAPDDTWPKASAKTFWNVRPFGRFVIFGMLLVAVYVVCVFLPTSIFEDLLAAGELRRGQPRTALTKAILLVTAHTLLFSIFTLIVARFLLIFPATSNCERWSLLDSWRRTRGVTLRLWLAILIACVTGWTIPAFILRMVALSIYAVGATLPALSFVIVSMIEDALAVVLSVGCLEIFFCSLIVPKVFQPKEPEPRTVTIGVR
jgi:hypothetical protein